MEWKLSFYKYFRFALKFLGIQYSIQPNPYKIETLDPTQSNPTQPNPTQPNPWVNSTHEQLCFGHYISGGA